MKIIQRRSKAAFTLIEMLAVVTIIVILAGIVITSMGFITEKQARSKASVQIALLTRALEEYKLDMGTYPATPDVASITSSVGTATSATYLWLPLFKDGYDYTNPNTPPANWTKATKIYCPDLNPISSNQGWVTKGTMPATSTIVDPWGNQYCYRSAAPLTGTTPNASTLNPDFDLWSMGKDGKTNPAVPSDKVNLDDIK
jgi:prepilin-type N-terminal cleavage/methylation domain-containing protein